MKWILLLIAMMSGVPQIDNTFIKENPPEPCYWNEPCHGDTTPELDVPINTPNSFPAKAPTVI